MDKVIKLVVSFLAGVMLLAVVLGLLFAGMIAVLFIAAHAKALFITACITVVVIAVWQMTYDLLFG